jgi:hypothetical protein
MSQSSTFFAPRFTGDRFANHAVPLNVLEDLANYEELLTALAKHIYREEHPERKRVPRGFDKGVSLQLKGIGEGNAIPNIILAGSLATRLFQQEHVYFERARDRIAQAIEVAHAGGDATRYIPRPLLRKFNKIGKNLLDDEAIEFAPGKAQTATLNREVRKNLILSSGEKIYTNSIALRARVKALDKQEWKATLIDMRGKETVIKVPKSCQAAIVSAFTGYEQGAKIVVEGVGEFDRQNTLQAFREIESVGELEPFDIDSRLEEIQLLPDGWYHGEGQAFSSEALDWFAANFEEHYDTTLPLPALFPTPEGCLQLEWNTDDDAVSLTIDLTAEKGDYFHLQKKTQEFTERDLNLALPDDWQKLNELLKPLLLA